MVIRLDRGRGALVVLIAVSAAAAACAEAPPATPFAPGSAADPREIPIVAHDYSYSPSVVELVPGETVTIQLVNGGLIVHEAIFGDLRVQAAWEAAEAAVAGAPPGPTPEVSVPPDVAGVRIVVRSGERRDATFTVPSDPASAPGGWFFGCHIPGHWAESMFVPVRFVDARGSPLPTGSSIVGSPFP